VLAYEKDPVTGIVRHLDDQCIGCQYCVLKCPYDVPKFNARLGIVRKCDMCSSRLAVGEAPACVQACPNQAIRITKVQTSTVTIEFRERGKDFLSGAPAGDYTLPTTRYVTPTFLSAGSETFESRSEPARGQRDPKVSRPAGSKAGVTLIAADSLELRPQPAHWPLVVMLVLTQASVGMAAVAVLQPAAPRSLLLTSLALAVVGLGASVFHLGRPLGAWRAFLNLKRSWMSREIVVFGMFPPLLAAAIAVGFEVLTFKSVQFTNLLRAGLETGAPLIGLLGVFCSAMIYHDTQRPLWHWRRSVLLFFGTTLTLGAAGAALIHRSPILCGIIIASTLAKLAVEISVLRHGTDGALTPLKKTALLITGRFQEVTMIRLACAVLGGVCVPTLLTMNVISTPGLLAAFAFALLLAGEIIERFLFFTTVVAPKMPGGVAT
jgi:DMSO reductase anchor subunit/ferredoxin